MEPRVGLRMNNGLEEFVVTGGNAEGGWQVFVPATLTRKTMSDEDARKEKDSNAPVLGQRRKSEAGQFVIYGGNASGGWQVSMLTGEQAGQQVTLTDANTRAAEVV